MDFEFRIYALEREGFRLLNAAQSHDKTKPKYWVSLAFHPLGEYAYGDTLSQALANAEAAIRKELASRKTTTTITLEDLGLA